MKDNDLNVVSSNKIVKGALLSKLLILININGAMGSILFKTRQPDFSFHKLIVLFLSLYPYNQIK